jgi:2-amino-4-hydroxy-6-hydroxymethyldihydropteridine diphosphokinase
MTTCLLGLGSNVGDRSATIQKALGAIAALPDVQVARRSKDYAFRPIGGPPDQNQFLNVAAVVETRIPPLPLLAELQQIETLHGRDRTERWAPRTLDIDLLLYGNEVAETDMLTLPHPRLSFRRFVLEPAAEIAPRMLHPIIGWPIEQLLTHLDAASDQLAILSPSEAVRRELAATLTQRFGARTVERPTFATAERHWPVAYSTWLALPAASAQTSPSGTKCPALPYAAAAFPKLTVMIDAVSNSNPTSRSQWPTIVRQPGRGPSLRLRTTERGSVETEVLAALQVIWSI